MESECDKFEKNVVVVANLFLCEFGRVVRNDGGI